MNRWAELTGIDKEALKLYVSLVEKHARTGEPVAYPPEYDFLRSEPRFITLEQKRKQVLGLEE